METMERLARKVQDAAEALVSLKKEKQALLYELNSIRERTKDYFDLSRQNQLFRRDRDRLRQKLERLNKKLEKLLVPTAAPMEMNGGTHEEHPE